MNVHNIAITIAEMRHSYACHEVGTKLTTARMISHLSSQEADDSSRKRQHNRLSEQTHARGCTTIPRSDTCVMKLSQKCHEVRTKLTTARMVSHLGSQEADDSSRQRENNMAWQADERIKQRLKRIRVDLSHSAAKRSTSATE